MNFLTIREQAATGNACGFHPVVQQTMHPIRNGDGPNVPSLPPQIYDCPMPFALLEMANRQRGEFVASEPASEKHAEQSSIPFALGPFAIWCLPESVALVVCLASPEPLDALDSPYSGCQVGAKQSGNPQLHTQGGEPLRGVG